MGQQLHRSSQLSLLLPVPRISDATHPVCIRSQSRSRPQQRQEPDPSQHSISVSFDDDDDSIDEANSVGRHSH